MAMNRGPYNNSLLINKRQNHCCYTSLFFYKITLLKVCCLITTSMLTRKEQTNKGKKHQKTQIYRSRHLVKQSAITKSLLVTEYI